MFFLDLVLSLYIYWYSAAREEVFYNRTISHGSSVFVSTSGPTPSSTVPLRLTPVALLVGCYLMESSMTVC